MSMRLTRAALKRAAAEAPEAGLEALGFVGLAAPMRNQVSACAFFDEAPRVMGKSHEGGGVIAEDDVPDFRKRVWHKVKDHEQVGDRLIVAAGAER